MIDTISAAASIMYGAMRDVAECHSTVASLLDGPASFLDPLDRRPPFFDMTDEDSDNDNFISNFIDCDASGVLDDLFPALRRIRDAAADVGPSLCDLPPSIALPALDQYAYSGSEVNTLQRLDLFSDSSRT